MRRLPIYFVLDVSESMIGENLRNLQNGLAKIVRDLRTDANALESVHISVVAFAGSVRTLAPLVELESFYPPRLPVGSGTSLGAALTHLMAEIDNQVTKTTSDRKGDWKPIVYLMTDGKPTDDAGPATRRWREHFSKRASLVAIAIGQFADVTALQELTDTVLVFSQNQDADFSKFARWVTASISIQSQAINVGASPTRDGISLAKFDDPSLVLVNGRSQRVLADEDSVILVGRCQRKETPYLMRFDRFAVSLPGIDVPAKEALSTEDGVYMVSGCYPVDEDYFEWSLTAQPVVRVNVGALRGGAGCPHCANPFAFAVCKCGRLTCVKGSGGAKCPWCGEIGTYAAASEDDPGMTIARGRG
ncbi:MAG: TerY-C metal binding domain-containing protein [Vicinamibacteria bacterium]